MHLHAPGPYGDVRDHHRWSTALSPWAAS